MNVRQLALDILYDVFSSKAYSNLELDSAIRSNDLNDMDKALLTNIIYGTLQNYYLLDWELNQVVNNKPKSKIRLLLLMSLYQLRYLTKVPSYAVVNEAVNIAKDLDGKSVASFVNAILHKFDKEHNEPKLESFADKWEYYALIYSHPYWLVKMWVKHYGEEITLKILKSSQVEANLTVRVNTLLATKEEVLKNDSFSVANLSIDALIYHGKTSISELEEFKKGWISVQDESSQMSALTLKPQPNSLVLDMCAAPGSKTTHLSQIMINTGKIIAVDLYQHRLDLLTKGLKRLSISNVETLCYDSTKLEEKYAPNTFDYILLDAPCSGFGVIRRKPDMLVNTHQESLDEIITLQKKMLDVAVNLLKDDGYLVYSTCTLNKKENELQIEALLKREPKLILESIKTIFPFEYASDGFFIAKLRKRGV
jgi:16S rRNA (cytosine967-C5)-methyltransferase